MVGPTPQSKMMADYELGCVEQQLDCLLSNVSEGNYPAFTEDATKEFRERLFAREAELKQWLAEQLA